MPSRDGLIARVRREYREMPGLCLTFAQACRLWQVDAPTCQRLIDQLLKERLLYRTASGALLEIGLTRIDGLA